MRQTFDKFDCSSSGELNLLEYKKVWNFLGKPGTDAEYNIFATLFFLLSMEAAFKGVDIDNSGYIEWDEFVFSLQAQKYGLKFTC